MFELRVTSWLNDKEVVDRVRKAAVQRLDKCGALVEAEAKQLLSHGSKTLGTAQFGDKKVPEIVQSSPPGSPPFLRSGNLRGSIQHERTGEGTVVVGPTRNAWYGRVHEFGCVITITKKMAAKLAALFGWQLWGSVGKTIHIPQRPFMRPALRNCQDKFAEQFKDLPIGGSVHEP